jgi:hypothetical protein
MRPTVKAQMLLHKHSRAKKPDNTTGSGKLKVELFIIRYRLFRDTQDNLTDSKRDC